MCTAVQILAPWWKYFPYIFMCKVKPKTEKKKEKIPPQVSRKESLRPIYWLQANRVPNSDISAKRQSEKRKPRFGRGRGSSLRPAPRANALTTMLQKLFPKEFGANDLCVWYPPINVTRWSLECGSTTASRESVAQVYERRATTKYYKMIAASGRSCLLQGYLRRNWQRSCSVLAWPQ